MSRVADIERLVALYAEREAAAGGLVVIGSEGVRPIMEDIARDEGRPFADVRDDLVLAWTTGMAG